MFLQLTRTGLPRLILSEASQEKWFGLAQSLVGLGVSLILYPKPPLGFLPGLDINTLDKPHYRRVIYGPWAVFLSHNLYTTV